MGKAIELMECLSLEKVLTCDAETYIKSKGGRPEYYDFVGVILVRKDLFDDKYRIMNDKRLGDNIEIVTNYISLPDFNSSTPGFSLDTEVYGNGTALIPKDKI